MEIPNCAKINVSLHFFIQYSNFFEVVYFFVFIFYMHTVLFFNNFCNMLKNEKIGFSLQNNVSYLCDYSREYL